MAGSVSKLAAQLAARNAAANDPQLEKMGEDERLDYLAKKFGVTIEEAARIVATSAYARNATHAKPPGTPTGHGGLVGGTYQTQLTPSEENQFLAWAGRNFPNPDFETDMPFMGYDLRGFWKAMIAGTAQPKIGANFRPTYPPDFETPFSLDFGRRSQYYKP